MEYSREVIEVFADFFRGRTDARGILGGGCVREIITPDHYYKHLMGEESLGIYMLLDDATVWFSAVDIDKQDFPLAIKVKQTLEEYNIAAYVAKSKSKGFHVYQFYNEPQQAWRVRGILRAVLARLGITAEIFPKADRLPSGGLGNYINLPYFGNSRMIQTLEGKDAPFNMIFDKIMLNTTEHVDRAVEKLKIRKEESPEASSEKRGAQQAQLPCFPRMMELSLEEGEGRNEIMFRLAVHLRRQGLAMKDGHTLLWSWNQKQKEPLDKKEYYTILNQGYNNRYGLGCQNDLIRQYCDKSCPIYKSRHLQTDELEPKQAVLTKKTLPLVKPALSFVDNITYITVPLYINEEVVKRGKLLKQRVERFITITSNRDYFVATPENYEVRNLQMVGKVLVPSHRWSLNSIITFLDGKINSPSFSSVFTSIAEKYRYYLDFHDERMYDYFPLWVIGTYFFPLYCAYPYVYVGGEKATGKTKCLELTKHLAFNGITSGNISMASVFRMVQAGRCTLLIDETEFLAHKEKTQEIRSLLNAGYKPGNPVYRTEKTAKDEFVPTPFDAYSPKMLANINGLEDVLETRTIPFIMKRTMNNIVGNREIEYGDKECDQIRDNLYLLAMTKGDLMIESYKTTKPISSIKSRDWEMWHPILSIAKIIDGESDLGLFDRTVALAEEKVNERLVEERITSGSTLLLRTLLKMVIIEDYYRPSEICNKMIESFGEEKWMTPPWVGWTLKKLGIKTYRTRDRHGILYHLKPEQIEEEAARYNVIKEDYDDDDIDVGSVDDV